MIETLYNLLEKIGYIHPVHPPFTHGPIGAVIVAFCLGLAILIWRRQDLLLSAYHAIFIAFILLIPTVLAGIMDWQHYYSGAWIFPIQMKIALAITLFILLSITLIVFRIANVRPSIKIMLLTLCLFNVMGLGYFGGQLVYEGRIPAVSEEFLTGQKIFVNHCSGCHPNGGNILFPNLPLRTAPQLKSYQTFIEFVRNPNLPSGSKGPMPIFTQSKLSDLQAEELYSYIIHGLANPMRSGDK
jgi:mono/diheme cytochrome c family protein